MGLPELSPLPFVPALRQDLDSYSYMLGDVLSPRWWLGVWAIFFF